MIVVVAGSLEDRLRRRAPRPLLSRAAILGFSRTMGVLARADNAPPPDADTETGGSLHEETLRLGALMDDLDAALARADAPVTSELLF